MHYVRAVLLSPTSVDTTAHLRFVSSLPSSGGETTGFASLLSSADSSLSEAAAPTPSSSSGKTDLSTGETRRRPSQPTPSLGRDSQGSPTPTAQTESQAAPF